MHTLIPQHVTTKAIDSMSVQQMPVAPQREVNTKHKYIIYIWKANPHAYWIDEI